MKKNVVKLGAFSRSAVGTALLVALGTQSALAAELPFDDFSVSQAQAVQIATVGTDTTTVTGAVCGDSPCIPGGEREIRVELIATGSEVQGVRSDVSNDELHYSQDSGGTRARGYTLWNGWDAGTCPDWTNITAIVVELKNDHPVPVTVRVNGAGGTTLNLAASLAFRDVAFAIQGPSCATTVELLIDGTNVEDLDVDVRDVTLTEEENIPAPIPAISTVGLAISLVGLPVAAAVVRRRRKSKK